MRKLYIIIIALLAVASLQAQSVKDEISADINRAGGNYYAYPGPPEKALSPTPRGYEPFYLSHYGRHGSRWLIGKTAYSWSLKQLEKADKAGKLTPKGKEVLEQLRLVTRASGGRDGELSRLGALQHQQIATRMYNNFPEIFRGKTSIKANSTIIIRCILSMENGLQALLRLNPELQITHDASNADMYYMNYTDSLLDSLYFKSAAPKELREFRKRHDKHEYTMRRLFNDDGYWQKEIDATRLANQLFKIASDMQSFPEMPYSMLADVFSAEEVYEHWLQGNAQWYLGYGPSKETSGLRPYNQRNLLRRIIAEADSCISLEHPGATLRYGHDTMVYPLTCLLGIDGTDTPVDSLEALAGSKFIDYKIIPMAANLQFVFYRNKKDHNDVLVKVLDNEREATLPLATDRWPYYKWNDFKAYYLKKLDAYAQ